MTAYVNDTNRMARLADDIERGVLSITELSGDDDGYGKLVPVETSRRMRQQETDLIVAALRANRALPSATDIARTICMNDLKGPACPCADDPGRLRMGFCDGRWSNAAAILALLGTDQPTLTVPVNECTKCKDYAGKCPYCGRKRPPADVALEARLTSGEPS
jgi:hypothetical protein